MSKIDLVSNQSLTVLDITDLDQVIGGTEGGSTGGTFTKRRAHRVTGNSVDLRIPPHGLGSPRFIGFPTGSASGGGGRGGQ